MRAKGPRYKKGLGGRGENSEHDVSRSEEKDNPSPRGEEEEEDYSNDDARGL